MENRITRRVLVVGGSRGIGAETVRRFAAQGCTVAFTYLHSAPAAESLAAECGAYAIRADSANEDDVRRAVSAARTQLCGDPEILVLNAGVSWTGLITDMSYDEWNSLLSVNLGGAFLYTRELIPSMVRNRFGRIVTVSSVWGMVGASCEAAYSASKAGLLGFTKALAKELGPSGITVNAVAPGVIRTDMLNEYDGETLAALAEETPIGRLGDPSDVAEAILFLAGKGGDFITGQVLSPNGGFTVV